MTEEKLCGWCERPVRNRYTTFLLPDGTTAYSHGKCRWFPETWKKLGVHGLDYKVRDGPDGEIFYDFKEDGTMVHVKNPIKQKELRRTMSRNLRMPRSRIK